MSESRVIYDPTRTRRVTISGADGTYTFLEEHFSTDPSEMCWIPQTHNRSRPVCGSLDIALREAKGRVEWLAAVRDVG